MISNVHQRVLDAKAGKRKVVRPKTVKLTDDKDYVQDPHLSGFTEFDSFRAGDIVVTAWWQIGNDANVFMTYRDDLDSWEVLATFDSSVNMWRGLKGEDTKELLGKFGYSDRGGQQFKHHSGIVIDGAHNGYPEAENVIVKYMIEHKLL